MASPVFDVATFNGFDWSAGSPHTYSHAGGSGSNRGLCLAIGASRSGASGGSFTPVPTYGGTSTVAQAAEVAQGSTLQNLFTLVAPAAGTQTVSITYNVVSASDPAGAISVTYTGVDQTTGFSGYQVGKATGTAASAGPVTGTNGDLVFAAVVAGANTTATAGTVTDRANSTQTNNGNTVRCAAGDLAQTGSVTPTWTIGTSTQWVEQAVNIIAVGSAATPIQGKTTQVQSVDEFNDKTDYSNTISIGSPSPGIIPFGHRTGQINNPLFDELDYNPNRDASTSTQTRARTGAQIGLPRHSFISMGNLAHDVQVEQDNFISLYGARISKPAGGGAGPLTTGTLQAIGMVGVGVGWAT